MKKFLLFIFLTFSIISVSNAQVAYDTVLTTQVAEGITYMKIIAPAVPWQIDVLKVNLKNPYNSVETAKGGGQYIGQEAVSTMAKRNNYPGHVVVGATNGDFFNIGPGIPVSIQIKDGQIIHMPSNRPSVGFDINNIPMISAVSYSGKVIDNGNSYSISGTNTDRGTDQLVVYNRFYGDTTGTNQFGTEISVHPIQQWLMNDTVKCVVVSKESNVGSMKISDTTVVLSGHGTAAAFLNDSVSVGDTVQVVNNIKPGIPKLKEMIGGNPMIVTNGKPYKGSTTREPRTAIGFTKDSTTMYLLTVDGRTNASVGVTFEELADLMLRLGIYQGLNLDGGGSTTMLVRDSVMNYPSGGGVERDVANALLVISSQPANGTLHSIQISPDFYRVFRKGTLQFNVQGRDEYYNTASIDNSKLSYSVIGNIGTIDQSGLFTAAASPDTGYVIADYNGMKDSCMIIVKSITSVDIYPKTATTDTSFIQPFNVDSYDVEGIKYSLPVNEYTWSTTDPSIGTVDSLGNFKGKSSGTTGVIVSYNGVSDTAYVNVVVKTGTVVLDSMENTGDFSLTGDNINTSGSNVSVSTDQSSQGSGSLKIDYSFTYDPAKIPYIYLNCNIPIAGVPDSLKLDYKADGPKHYINYTLENSAGESFGLNNYAYATTTDRFDVLATSFSKIYVKSSGAVLSYPLTLTQIAIKLAGGSQSGQTYTGTIYLDNLRVTYPSGVTGIENSNEVPQNYMLYQNYPNPFNPTTVINYQLPVSGFVTLKVYDALGREIATLVNGEKSSGNYTVRFDASQLASGVYFYRLSTGNINIVKKMILLR